MQTTIKHSLSPYPAYDLSLADGSNWVIAGKDPYSFHLVERLSKIMMLQPHHRPGRRLFLVTGDRNTIVEEGEDLICELLPSAAIDSLFNQLTQISFAIMREAQIKGGILLHGALAEWNQAGVILAAPGGTGKTTASQRLHHPWRSLCDDASLVVRDGQGNYLAHPWPTWSRFYGNGPGGSWDVQYNTPLKGIFFLAQAQENWVETVGKGEAVCMLVPSTEQISRPIAQELDAKQARSLRLQRFENVCSLSRLIPIHILHLSIHGSFWNEIEQALTQTSELIS